MTQDELQLLSDLCIANIEGMAGAVEPEYIPEAHRLQERGWLEHHWHGDDMVWSLTEPALTSLGLASLERTDEASQN